MALGKPERRFLLWVVLSAALAAAVAPDFPALISQSLDDTFGSLYPALPFASLLVLLFMMRWKELADVLRGEGGLSTRPLTRLAGVCGVAALLLLRGVMDSRVELASAALVLSFYFLALTINPASWRLVLPYALVYVAGVTLPPILQEGLGAPLAAASSGAAATLVHVTGIPISWSGVDFQFTTQQGDLISAAVTPGCSSIISMTTFLGLLSLMYIDMRKSPSRTLATALAGVVVLFLLNAVRITVLILLGYTGGSGLFWEAHNWVGYVIFLGFYLAVLLSYSGAKTSPTAAAALQVSPSLPS